MENVNKLEKIKLLFEAQRVHRARVPDYHWRKTRLKRLAKGLHDYEAALKEALFQDFKKPHTETELTEIYPALSEIRHTLKHLRTWMSPERRATPLPLLGESRITYEPKGVALIISPWNYPVNLTVAPLISALAAGCRAILKPSELTPHTSEVLKEMCADLFSPDEVVVCTGGVEISQELLKLPFDHIFFTGSTQVGKIIMKAAAENLSSVTLELGGKSPTVIGPKVNFAQAVRKITWGKWLNNGQTCIAPDYLLLPKGEEEKFVQSALTQLEKFYGTAPKNSENYARIVSERHFERLHKLVQEAVQQGATAHTLGDAPADPKDRYLPPTLLTGVTPEMGIMQEEIFGPVLPILPYENTAKAFAFIQQREKPLAAYVFSGSKSFLKEAEEQISAGGMCFNDCILHISTPELPFGGVNHSGIGKSHGHWGFLEFSNAKSVLHAPQSMSAAALLYPPYTDFSKRLLSILRRWL